MKIPKELAIGSIPTDIILTLVTCGIYGLFWQARLFRVVNGYLGEERFNFWAWFFLTLITCSIYNLYTHYQLGSELSAIQAREKKPVNPSLNILGLVLSLVGLHIVTMAIEQHEINQLYA